MAKYEYISMWETEIHVNGLPRQPGERFIEEETQELKNLCSHEYIMQVKKIKKEKK